jgi:hypothetical protein
LTIDKVGSQHRHSIVSTLGKTIFELHILALGITALAQAQAEREANPIGVSLLRNPITGIEDCCAPAASGHAAVPPSRVMKSRRCNWFINAHAHC